MILRLRLLFFLIAQSHFSILSLLRPQIKLIFEAIFDIFCFKTMQPSSIYRIKYFVLGIVIKIEHLFNINDIF